MERWERDEIDRRFARLERERLKLEETNQRTEQRLWELESRDRTCIHLSYEVVFWAILAGFVAFEIVMITLKVSAP